MIRYTLLAASFSLVLVSAGLAAPLSPTLQLKQAATSDLVQVKKYKGKKYKGKKWNKNYGHRNDWHRRHYRGRYDRGRYYGGGYRYGGRYYGRRYGYRPRYWQSWGCINVGPVWYCP
jgi:hypothetical protein